MDPISRSANPFCHGARGAIGLSRMPMARRRCRTIEPKTRSRSRMRYPGAEPPRKSLGDLACNPFGRRTVRHANPDELSAVEPNDDETIEQAEGKRRHDEKVHRRDLWQSRLLLKHSEIEQLRKISARAPRCFSARAVVARKFFSIDASTAMEMHDEREKSFPTEPVRIGPWKSCSFLPRLLQILPGYHEQT